MNQTNFLRRFVVHESYMMTGKSVAIEKYMMIDEKKCVVVLEVYHSNEKTENTHVSKKIPVQLLLKKLGLHMSECSMYNVIKQQNKKLKMSKHEKFKTE